jgi:hypothetical protein
MPACIHIIGCIRSYYRNKFGHSLIIVDAVSTFPFRSSSLDKKLTKHEALLSYIVGGDFEPAK